MNNALSDTPLPPTVQRQAHKPSQVERVFIVGQAINHTRLCKEHTKHRVQLQFKRQLLLMYTFAGAQILINENLQLSVCFNQTSLQRSRM